VDNAPPSYRGHRYPAEVISHCVWLYHRFPLTSREVEELMLQRGVIVSYETIRRRRAEFGQIYANGPRRYRPRTGDKWLYLLERVGSPVRRVRRPRGVGCD
jgi:putative transposase